MCYLKKTFVIHTWLRSPLEYRYTPFSMLVSLSDSNREFIHSISRELLNHKPLLWGLLIFPPSRLSLLSISDSVLPTSKGHLLWHIKFSSWITLFFLTRHYRLSHLAMLTNYLNYAEIRFYQTLPDTFLTWYLQGYFSASVDPPMWLKQTGEKESSLWRLPPPLLHRALINMVHV